MRPVVNPGLIKDGDSHLIQTVQPSRAGQRHPHLGVIADAVLARGNADVELGGQFVMAALRVERGRRARADAESAADFAERRQYQRAPTDPAAATIETTSAAMTTTATVMALPGPARAAPR